MTEEKDLYPVDRSGLTQPPESFRTLLDIDGKQFGIVLTAFNRRSIVALLQILMIVNKRRISGYVVRTEGLIEGSSGELVASVPSRQFTEQVTKGTRLQGPAPQCIAPVVLPFFDKVQVKPKDPPMTEDTKTFILEVVIDGVVEKFPVTGPNEDSVIALLTAATCDKMPRISGWNLYDAAGQMIVTVPAMMFLARLGEISPLGKQPADPKAAGWRALPTVAPTSEEWQKSMDAAKRAGKTPT